MRKLILAIFAIAAVTGLSACSSHTEVKSPCVGAEGSPCERHRPINQEV